MFRVLPYKSFLVEITIPKGKFKIAGRVDGLLDNPRELFLSYVEQLGCACALAYLEYKDKLENKCLYANTEFVMRLASCSTRSFEDCNYLSTNQLGFSLPTNHHMIRLLQNELAIGVDVAVQQFRNDDVIAEISISSSHEGLVRLLSQRHGTIAPWKLNAPFATDFENSCFDNSDFRKKLVNKKLEFKAEAKNDMQIQEALPGLKPVQLQSKLCVIL